MFMGPVRTGEHRSNGLKTCEWAGRGATALSVPGKDGQLEEGRRSKHERLVHKMNAGIVVKLVPRVNPLGQISCSLQTRLDKMACTASSTESTARS